MSKYKNKTILLVSSTLSNLGDNIIEYALRWWIAKSTSSTLVMALIMSLETLSMALFNLIGGVFSDRYNRKKIIISMDFVCSFISFLLFLLINENKVDIPLIVILNSLLAIAFSFYSPAIRSIVKKVITNEDIPKVNSWLNGLNELVKIIGPLLGIFVVDSIGIRGAFLINAISFLISGILELFLEGYVHNKDENSNMKNNLLQDMKDAYQYILNKKNILYILILALFANFFISGYSIILPFITQRNYGLALTIQASGGILGAYIVNHYSIKLAIKNISNYLKHLL